MSFVQITDFYYDHGNRKAKLSREKKNQKRLYFLSSPNIHMNSVQTGEFD